MATHFNFSVYPKEFYSLGRLAGKTTLMTLMRHVAQPNYKFIMKTCRDISFEFIKDGYQTIHKYSNGNNSYQ